MLAVRDWLIRAAEGGEVAAMAELGRMLALGLGGRSTSRPRWGGSISRPKVVIRRRPIWPGCCVCRVNHALSSDRDPGGLSGRGAGAAMAQDCPFPPEPVISLAFDSRYADGDASRSEIDPTRRMPPRTQLPRSTISCAT